MFVCAVFDTASVRRALAVLLICFWIPIATLERNASADDLVAGGESVVRVFVGTVVDVHGEPISDALVEWGHFLAEQSEREFTFTNASGEYRLETHFAWNDYRLGVHQAGFGPRWIDGLIPSRESSEVHFVLPSSKELSGVVVDPDGTPIPGVIVRAQTGEYLGTREHGFSARPSPFPGPARIATTNERGEFLFRDLSEVVTAERIGGTELTETRTQTADLTFVRDGAWLGRQQFSVGAAATFEAPAFRRPVTPETAGVLAGIVVDANSLEPITNFHSRWRFEVETESFDSPRGEFSLSDSFLRGHEYDVEVFADGYAPASVSITAIGTDEKPQARIALVPHAPLQVEVVDAVSGDGLPAVEILSGVYQSDDTLRDVFWHQLRQGERHHQLADQQRVSTDAEGRATILEGESRCSLFILHPGYARTIVYPEDRESMTTEEKTLRIELVPESRIRGRIVHDLGPGDRFSVLIGRLDLNNKFVNENFFGEGDVDETGAFEIDRLGSGTYDVRVLLVPGAAFYHPCLSTEVKLADGEQVDLEFGAPAGPHSLRGQARPFTILRLSPSQPAGTMTFFGCADADGHFEISGLPEGNFRVDLLFVSSALGLYWDRVEYVPINGDTERDFTAVPIEGF